MKDTILEKDTISVTINDDHTYNCTAVTIGRTGENSVTQLEITIPEELSAFGAYLDFKKPKGETVKTERLDIANNKVEYDIPLYLLDENGNLEVQLVLQNENGEIWKSAVKKYVVLKSIDAGDGIPYKEDFITEAQRILDETVAVASNNAPPIKDSASGTSAIRLDGVSPLEHDISVKAIQEVKILGAGEVVCQLDGFAGDYELVGIDIWDYELGEENQAKLFEIAEIIEENDYGYATIRFTDGSYIEDTDNEVDINGLKVGDILLYENLDFTSYIYLSKLTEIGTEQIPLTDGEVVTEKIIARGEYTYDIDGVDSYYYETGWHYINGKWFYIIHEDWLCSTRVLKTTTETKTVTVTRYGKNLWDNTNAYFSYGSAFTRTETGFIFDRSKITAGQYVSNTIPMEKGVTYVFSADTIGSTNALFYIYADKVYGKLLKSTGVSSKRLTYTADADYPNAKFTYILSSTTPSLTVENMMVYVSNGNANYDYEPYKEPATFTADENGNITVPSLAPTTTIVADSGVSLSAEYNVDTKTYIDRKFAELASMISSV